jgi:hypothetical protein
MNAAHEPLEPTADTVLAALACCVEAGMPEVVGDVLALYGAPPCHLVVHEGEAPDGPHLEPVEALGHHTLGLVERVGDLSRVIRQALADGRVSATEAAEIRSILSTTMSGCHRLDQTAGEAVKR